MKTVRRKDTHAQNRNLCNCAQSKRVRDGFNYFVSVYAGEHAREKQIIINNNK